MDGSLWLRKGKKKKGKEGKRRREQHNDFLMRMDRLAGRQEANKAGQLVGEKGWKIV